MKIVINVNLKTMITEELISFKTATLAKEKGCKFNGLSPLANDVTQSLLQKWLREEHSLHIELETDLYDDMKTACFRGYAIVSLVNFKNPHIINFEVFKTYEEALEKGLQAALKLLK